MNMYPRNTQGNGSNRSSASSRKYGDRGSASNRYGGVGGGNYDDEGSSFHNRNSQGNYGGGGGFHVSSATSSQTNFQDTLRGGGNTGNNSGGGGTGAFTDVYDPDFINIIHVPTHKVFHRPSLQMGVNRLVLCRNNATTVEGLVDNTSALAAFEAQQAENGGGPTEGVSSISSPLYGQHSQPPIIFTSPTQLCNKGHHCKFVHADIVGCKRQSVHVSYALRTPAESKYQRAVGQVITSLLQSGASSADKEGESNGGMLDSSATTKNGSLSRTGNKFDEIFSSPSATAITPSVLSPRAYAMFKALSSSQQTALVERTRVYVTAPNNRAPATEVFVATVLATKGSQQLMPVVVRDIERWAAAGGGAVQPIDFLSGAVDSYGATGQSSASATRRASNSNATTSNSKERETGIDAAAAAVESLLSLDENNTGNTVSNGSFEVTSGKGTGAVSPSASENNFMLGNNGGSYAKDGYQDEDRNNSVTPPLRSTSNVNNPNNISTPTQCLSHCAHYYFNRLCNRGNKCHFIHSLFIDSKASADSQQRAPAPHSIGISPELEERKRRQQVNQTPTNYSVSDNIGGGGGGVGNGWTSGNNSVAGLPFTVTVGSGTGALTPRQQLPSHQPLSVVVGAVGSNTNPASRANSRSSSVQDGLLNAYTLEQHHLAPAGGSQASFTVTANSNAVNVGGISGKSPGRGVASSVSSSHGITAAGGSVRTASSSQPQNITVSQMTMPPSAASSTNHVLSPKAAPFVFKGHTKSSSTAGPNISSPLAGSGHHNQVFAADGADGAHSHPQQTPLASANASPAPQPPTAAATAAVPDPLLTYLATLLSAVLHSSGAPTAAGSAIPGLDPALAGLGGGAPQQLPMQLSPEPRQVWVTDYEGNPIPCWVGSPPTPQMRLMAQQQQLQFLWLKQQQLFSGSGVAGGGIPNATAGSGGGLLGNFINNNNIHQSTAAASGNPYFGDLNPALAAGGAGSGTVGGGGSDTTSRSDGGLASSPVALFQHQYSGYPTSDATTNNDYNSTLNNQYGSGHSSKGARQLSGEATSHFQDEDDGDVFVIPTPNGNALGHNSRNHSSLVQQQQQPLANDSVFGTNSSSSSKRDSTNNRRNSTYDDGFGSSSPPSTFTQKQQERGGQGNDQGVRDLLLSLSAVSGAEKADAAEAKVKGSNAASPNINSNTNVAKKSSVGVIGGKKFSGSTGKANPMSPFADKGKQGGFSPSSTQTSSPSDDVGGAGGEWVAPGSGKSGKLESTISRGSPRGSPVTSLTSRDDVAFQQKYKNQNSYQDPKTSNPNNNSNNKHQLEGSNNAKRGKFNKSDYKAESSPTLLEGVERGNKSEASSKGINILARPFVASSSSSNFCSPLFDATSSVTSPVQQQQQPLCNSKSESKGQNNSNSGTNANVNGGRGGRGGGGFGSPRRQEGRYQQNTMLGSGTSSIETSSPAFVQELLSSAETQ